MMGIFAVVAAAFAVGAILYLTIKLTISYLKSYRKRKRSKIMAAQVKDLIKQAPSMSLDDLDDQDIILAEYDPVSDDLVQDIAVAQDIDTRVSNLVDGNGGIVVFN